MYYVDLLVDDQPVFSLAQSDKDEQVWLAVGLDLLDYHGVPASDFEIGLDMALSIALNQQESLARYGDVDSVLHFLMSVRDACTDHRDAIVEINY